MPILLITYYLGYIPSIYYLAYLIYELINSSINTKKMTYA
jgi:hypothetical protein